MIIRAEEVLSKVNILLQKVAVTFGQGGRIARTAVYILCIEGRITREKHAKKSDWSVGQSPRARNDIFIISGDHRYPLGVSNIWTKRA